MELSELQDSRILVLGLGMSGRSAARFCAARGARVVAADERPAESLGDLSDLDSDIDVRIGQPFPDAADFDLTVPSPGIPAYRYRDRARVVWGDIELAARALEVPIVAVTGTNGKSTTVRLIEAMLRAAGVRARAAGNVGIPALDLPGEPLDAAVLEVSSFQLETTEAFRPRVAVVLNLTPDHLDRHGDLAGYVAAKRRIVAAQGPQDYAVLNWDDPLVRDFAEVCDSQVVPLSASGTGPSDPVFHAFTRAAWLDAGAIVLRERETTKRVSLDSLELVGRHNLENALAALTATWLLGADVDKAIDGLTGFRCLPHRSEVVRTTGGVTWVNDSKATNPGAAQSALAGLRQPLIWIAGGRDKALSFEPLAESAASHVRRALLIGEAAPLLERALAGHVPSEVVGDMEHAVARAAEIARPGDIVLLAPACSSFDQFDNFEDRGDCFRRLVLALHPASEPANGAER